MTIEIHEPELEALIRLRMERGRFRSIEEVLIQALQCAPLPEATEPSERTGADLVAAMQGSPYKEIDIEPSRPPSAPERKSLARLFAESPFKGLDIDFPRDREPMREAGL